jgi:hypothetical protein
VSGWVKVPQDWMASEDVERLSPEVVVFHLSALAESGRHRADGRVTERMVRRLWPVSDPDAVIGELVTSGWWEPRGDGWLIRDWQTFLLSASEIDNRREVSRKSSERHRRHKAGDHTMCDRCEYVRQAKRDASRDASVTSPGPDRTGPEVRGPEVPTCPHGWYVGPDGATGCEPCTDAAHEVIIRSPREASNG